ncbi:hypothetical protein QBC42DRAFT_365 [Cladorrhinum samala]|uniref:Uncharacterized protein n=1 Tax=Cladorrhinum samala TaxID=585594 RepID=A0AAV9I3B0_9PEZI|nr:hypothetical protein QBC42DRAFT_365 [Cladorrhinum samala]
MGVFRLNCCLPKTPLFSLVFFSLIFFTKHHIPYITSPIHYQNLPRFCKGVFESHGQLDKTLILSLHSFCLYTHSVSTLIFFFFWSYFILFSIIFSKSPSISRVGYNFFWFSIYIQSSRLCLFLPEILSVLSWNTESDYQKNTLGCQIHKSRSLNATRVAQGRYISDLSSQGLFA